MHGQLVFGDAPTSLHLCGLLSIKVNTVLFSISLPKFTDRAVLALWSFPDVGFVWIWVNTN